MAGFPGLVPPQIISTPDHIAPDRGRRANNILSASSIPGEEPKEDEEDRSSSMSFENSYEQERAYERQQDTLYNQFFRFFVQKIAELSLEDYRWRTDLFRSNQAERMLEESLARMRGENATYVRPMDAPGQQLGPLGRWRGTPSSGCFG